MSKPSSIVVCVLLAVCNPAIARAEWLTNGNAICRVPGMLGAPVGAPGIYCFTNCGRDLALFWPDARVSSPGIYRSGVSDAGPPPSGPGDVAGTLFRPSPGSVLPAGAVTVPLLTPPVTQFSTSATILVWAEGLANGPTAIRAQRLDDPTDWGPDGVLVSGNTIAHSSMSVVPDDSGGVFVSWLSAPQGASRAYVQRIDAYGNIRFGSEGLLLGPDTTVHTAPVLARDGHGGCYVMRSARDSITRAFVSALYHLDRSGSAVAGWPVQGLRTLPLGLATPWLRADAAGVWVAWDNAQTLSDNSTAAVPYATRLEFSGAMAPGWSVAGVPALTGRQGDARLEDVAVGVSGDLLMLIKYTQLLPVYSPTREDEVAQRIALSGGVAAGWPASGVTVCDAPGTQWYGRMFAQGDGMLCVWSDQRSDDGDIYASRLLANGQRASDWPANGLLVCGAAGQQYQPLLAPNAVGGGFIVWLDRRDFATHQVDLYAHTVTGDARLDVGDATPRTFALSQVRPNPARGRVQLQIDLPSESDVTLEVFDVTGRRVHDSLTHEAAGSRTLCWDTSAGIAPQIRPGLYLMRVRAGTQEAHARVVVTQ